MNFIENLEVLFQKSDIYSTIYEVEDIIENSGCYKDDKITYKDWKQEIASQLIEKNIYEVYFSEDDFKDSIWNICDDLALGLVEGKIPYHDKDDFYKYAKEAFNSFFDELNKSGE